MPADPDWLVKAKAEGRVTEGKGVNLQALGLNPTFEGVEGGKKPNKFRNQVVTVNGVTFHSKKEAKRWAELEFRLKCNDIRNLRRGKAARFEFVINDVKVGHYTPDAVYEARRGPPEGDLWELVVEDTKSEITRRDEAYRIRKRLMKAIHNIEILEV